MAEMSCHQKKNVNSQSNSSERSGFLKRFPVCLQTQMTTIIRVKRHRGEDPVDALILSCKRKKKEDSSSSDSELFKKILNFSGTVEEKDDKKATNTVHSFNKDSKHLKFTKNHVPDIKEKLRKEWKEKADDDRFKLLSCLRSNHTKENLEVCEEGEKTNITIVDVSKEPDEKTLENNTSDSSYVYDLYSTHFESDADFNDLYMENLLSVQPLEYDLEYRNGEDCYDEVDPDEDDSNDENNWRNDYPDTDSEMDEDPEEDYLAKLVNKCHIDNEYDLSGDSGEEEYLNYNDDSENYHYYEAEDFAGRSYARYKANAMKHLMDDDDDKVKDEDYDSDGEYLDCNDSD